MKYDIGSTAADAAGVETFVALAADNLDDRATAIRSEIAAGDAALAAGLGHYLRAGEMLTEVRLSLPRGDWTPWLYAHAFDPRRAQRYMQLAANPTRVSGAASLRVALQILAAPKAPRVELAAGRSNGASWRRSRATRPVSKSTTPDWDSFDRKPAAEDWEPTGYTADEWRAEVARRCDRRDEQARRLVLKAIEHAAAEIVSDGSLLAADERADAARLLRDAADQLDGARS